MMSTDTLEPIPLSLSEIHRDRTLDWKKFHATFPQLEYFTENMIVLDSDAFKEDEFYAARAKNLLAYFDPFVDIVANLSASEVERLTARIRVSHAGFFIWDYPMNNVKYLKRIPGLVKKACEKANTRYGLDDLWKGGRNPYYNLALCTKE